MRRKILLALGFVLAVFGALIYSTLGAARYRCEVCVAYEGRSACRTAAASTREQALRTAVENACAQVASGVTGATVCQSTPPARVRWLAEPEKP